MVGVCLLVLLFLGVGGASAWLSDYDYRTQIEIDGNTEDLTDYQVQITLQGTNSSAANYVDFDKILTGGADIHLTDSDKTTEIDFWIDEWVDTSGSESATVWLEVPSVLTAGTKTVYVYYGKTDASSGSDGDNTFLFFDDFDDFDAVSVDGFSRISQQPLFSGSGSEDWLGRPVLIDDGNKWILAYLQGSVHGYDANAVIHIRFSEDEGATWTNADTFTNGSPVNSAPFNEHSTNAVADPILIKAPNGDSLLHIGEKSIDYGGNVKGTYQYRSTDGGASWIDEGLINNDSEIWSGQDYTIVGSDIYAIFFKDAGSDGPPHQTLLYKSSDNGTSWILVSQITTTIEATNEGGIEYVGDNTLLVVLRDGSANTTYQRISTDLGQTWGTLTDILSSVGVLQRPRMRIFSDEPNRVYLYGRDKLSGKDYTVLYYTDDDGTTWSTKFYPDSSSYDDTGYSDVLKQTDGEFYMLSYAGTMSAADIKEYIFEKTQTLQVNASKWVEDNAITSIGNSQVTYQETDAGAGWGIIRSVSSVSRPFIAEVDYTITSGNYTHFLFGPSPDSSQSTANSYVWWQNINNPTNPKQNLIYIEDGVVTDIQRNVDVSPDIANNERFNQSFVFHNLGENASTNGMQYISAGDTTYFSGKLALGTDVGSVIKVDTIKVRMYTLTEPTSTTTSAFRGYDKIFTGITNIISATDYVSYSAEPSVNNLVNIKAFPSNMVNITTTKLTASASIILDGVGTTNLSVQMPDTTTIYTAKYDGTNCNNLNCTFTQLNGKMNFSLLLGSEHTLDIEGVATTLEKFTDTAKTSIALMGILAIVVLATLIIGILLNIQSGAEIDWKTIMIGVVGLIAFMIVMFVGINIFSAFT